ncbi:MAG TPA: glutaminase [Thermoanaerobaculia bacterium]|nr:glutaminase [Thermoanaerobaculia bacterium]
MTGNDLQRVLHEIREEIQPLLGQGRVADYIPPLASVPPDRFGMVVRTIDGEVFRIGDADERFSIQSIAKVFSLTLAMRLEGDAIWSRVGREPSGTAFNSLVQLEVERGIPRNPFINAGAIVVLDAVLRHRRDGEDAILDFVRRAAANPSIDYDLDVAEAEHRTGHRNRALAHFLKSFGNLRNDADAVLDAYFRLCSISMSCVELADAFSYLATSGHSPSGEEVATPRQVKRVNAVMLACGVYDEAGDYAYRVGLPAKSGVGGGVVAVMPGKFVAAVWSPGLSEKGNSLAGTMALELLTTKTAISIF